ncbi:unnamed protein product [Blepharisma stoltei]|uniref:Histone H2A n=1 Tax=Blepharisma stoltei TaxID=1481888 RepID=A0AAU9IK24_9CILI|nr:unnamed protein product [Blepharisma stoltei]
MPGKKSPSKPSMTKKAETQISNRVDEGADKLRITSHERAGLIFPVGRILRIMKEGRLADRISDKSAVAIAAVLEYLSAEIIELAGDQAKEERSMKKHMIKPRHITLAVRADEELSEFIGEQVIIPMGGVIPHILPEIEKKTKRKRAKKGQDGEEEESGDEEGEAEDMK